MGTSEQAPAMGAPLAEEDNHPGEGIDAEAGPSCSSAATQLVDLPRECLLLIASLAGPGSAQEAMEQACKELKAVLRTEQSWCHRLKHDFGVRLNLGSTDRTRWCLVQRMKILHRQLHTADRDLRFHGCFTDGGCDGGQMRYWVDNLFIPNHWESYCSHLGANVNCVGLLLEVDDAADQEAADHRRYLINRCQHASNVLFQVPMVLETWTTAELEHFFQELYNELQHRTPVGALLMHGIGASSNPAMELVQLDRTMDRLNMKLRGHDCILCGDGNSRHQEQQQKGGEGSGGESSQQGRSASPRSPRKDERPQLLPMFDTRVTPLLWPPSHCNWAASVRGITVSRAGHFSCPIACGAVFLGNFQTGNVRHSNAGMRSAIQAVTAERCSTALDGATTLKDVEAGVEAGKLPPIAATGGYAGAEWVEFDLEGWQQRHGSGCLQPIVWFRFCLALEMKERAEKGWPRTQGVPAQQPGLAETLTRNTAAMQHQQQHQVPAAGPEPCSDAAEAPGSSSDEDNGGGGGWSADEADSEQEVGMLWDRMCKTTEGRNTLEIPLVRRHGGNLALVKLISHEDLRQEWEDDNTDPNVDINFVRLRGSRAALGCLTLDG